MALDTDLAEPTGIRSETDGGGGDSLEGHRFDRRDLAALFLVVTAGRCIFNADRKVFSLFPDEPASLAMARWISGGPHWDMYWSSTWRPGYSTLLAPIFWLTEDQESIVRMGLLLNACIGGLSVVLLAVLASRLTTLSTKAALVVCAAIGLSAPSLSASAHLWAEPLVTLTFLGTV
jgi:hypothetical protein